MASKITAGRYDRATLRTVPAPANGLGQPVPSLSARTALHPSRDFVVGAVRDPFDERGRILATVNRRTDILELELSHERISEAAYQVGRIIQAVFERAGGGGGSCWAMGDRVDAAWAHEAAIVRSLETARQVQAYVKRISATLGMIDCRLLRAVLGDRQSFAEVAAARGRGGERGASYVATRFRDALEELATAWAARGPSHG